MGYSVSFDNHSAAYANVRFAEIDCLHPTSLAVTRYIRTRCGGEGVELMQNGAGEYDRDGNVQQDSDPDNDHRDDHSPAASKHVAQAVVHAASGAPHPATTEEGPTHVATNSIDSDDGAGGSSYVHRARRDARARYLRERKSKNRAADAFDSSSDDESRVPFARLRRGPRNIVHHRTDRTSA